ncbi:MAG: putative Zn-dependent protease [Gammaproteobacteria bacterium]|jgi:predicted Zn-dependent protease
MNTIATKFSLLLIAAFIVGCAKNLVSGDHEFVTLSESDEIAQGASYHQSIIAQYGVYDDPKLQAYITDIGQQIASKSHRSHLKYHFTVLDSPDINAFALPIYITRGIMAYLDSEAELAGVLGHEIGHVTARHSVRQQSGQFAAGILNVVVAATTGSTEFGQLSQQLSTGMIRGYGRKHELEADQLGAQYLHKSRYDPESMLDVIGVLKDQELFEKAQAKKQNREPRIYHGVFSTHPENDQRLQTVITEAKTLSATDYKDDNRDRYLSHIDGLVWGQNPRQGVVVDNRFIHAGLGFAIQFSPGWEINNSPTVLMSQNVSSAAIFQLSLEKLNADEDTAGLLKRITNNASLDVSTEAYGNTAQIQVTVANNVQPARVSAIKLDDSQALFIIGSSTEPSFPTTDQQLLAINLSFSRLSVKDIEAIKTPRLKVIPVEAQDSFASLAKTSAIENDAEDSLRLLNHAFPSGRISDFKTMKDNYI